MNNTGWICLHRDILNWEWWDDRNTRDLFITCLLMANHEDVRWHGQVVKRGSFVTTLKNLAKKAGLTLRELRTSLERLKTTHEMTQQTTHQYSIITITNYAKYQDKKNENDTANDTANDTQTTHKRHTNDTQTTHNNNITNKQNNNNISLTTRTRDIYNKQDVKGEGVNSENVKGELAGAPAEQSEKNMNGGSVVMKIEDLALEYGTEIMQGGENYKALHRLTKLTSDKLVEYLAQFNDTLFVAQVTHKTRSDYRRHFLSWLKIQLEIEKRNSGQLPVTGGQKKENPALKRLHNVGDFDFEGVRSDF